MVFPRIAKNVEIIFREKAKKKQTHFHMDTAQTYLVMFSVILLHLWHAARQC